MVRLDNYLGKIVDDMKEDAKIALVGPSTLGRDNSILFFSELLRDIPAELIAIEYPGKKKCYGSLELLSKQMDYMIEKNPYLKKPKYVPMSAYSMGKHFNGSLDLIYDHCSFYWIVREQSEDGDLDRKKADELLNQYYNSIVKGGKIIIGEEARDFELPVWDELIMPAIDNLGLKKKLLKVKDIQMHKKYPEIIELSDYAHASWSHQYQCRTIAVLEK